MKTFHWRGALTVVLAFAAIAGGQTVWDGVTFDTDWYTKSPSSSSYKISKASELAGLASLVNSGKNTMSGKTITLTGDIALNPTEQTGWEDFANPWEAIGTPDHPFQGTIDGGGFTVRGVYVIKSDADYQGLFGYVNKMAKINKLRVAESKILGNDYVGGLVGSDSGTITDCYSTATVGGGKWVGGLVGSMSARGSITNSYATGEVTGSSYVGGLVGGGVRDTIRTGYAIGNVTGTGDYVGGLVGYSGGGYIINSYAIGDVNGGTGNYVGGLAGSSDTLIVLSGTTKINCLANIVNSYAVGKVTGGDFVGGLVGRKTGGAIRNCYSAGLVPDGGGLVGKTEGNATITYGYYALDAKINGEDCDEDCDDEDVTFAPKGVGIPKMSEYIKSEEFVSLLNVAAYALKNNTYKENTNKWYYLKDQYPRLSTESVTDAVFASCFAKDGKGDYGSGSKEDSPYLIETRQHLENLAVYVNCGATQSGKFFKLKNDIKVADTAGWMGWNGNNKWPLDEYGNKAEWTPIGQQPSDTAGQPKVRFNGSFDGGGFVISGVYVNKSEDETFSGRYQGLFGRVEKEGNTGGSIKNVGIVNSYISAYCYVGGLVGWNEKGTVTKSYARNLRVEAYGGRNGAGGIGGLVGINNSAGVVINSYTEDAYVYGEINMAGGLVGWNSGNSRISYCHTKLSDVSVIGDDVGGLVGRNDGSTVRDSYANVDVFADGDGAGKGGNVIGGLVGMNFNATVAKCYASGTIRGNSSLGGLVGSKMSNGKVDSSYYRGDVATIKNDYGTPKTEEEMKSAGTYKGWDFVNVWAIDDESVSYPYLGMRRAAKPVISKHPASADINRNATCNLSVTASVTGGTISYQWYVNGADKPDNKNGAMISGAKSASYTVTSDKTAKDTTLYYYVVVTNTSNVAVADSVAGSSTASVASNVAKVKVGGGGAVQSGDREIPKLDSSKAVAAISPVSPLTAEFAAGPNPASKSAGLVNFYRKGKRISDGELRIYDVSGNMVRKIRVVDGDGGRSKRKVGEWELTDGKGRIVSEGAYLVKGYVTADGKREKVSVIVGVVK